MDGYRWYPHLEQGMYALNVTKIVILFQQISWEDWFELFRCDEMLYGGWLEHIHGWWTEFSTEPNVLFVKYEDSKKDIRGTIHKLAEFLNRDLTPKQVSNSVCKPIRGRPLMIWGAEDIKKKFKATPWKTNFNKSSCEKNSKGLP